LIKEQQRRIRECKLMGVSFPEEWVVLIMDDCVQTMNLCTVLKWNGWQATDAPALLAAILCKNSRKRTESRQGTDGIFALYAMVTALGLTEFASFLDYKLFQGIIAGATWTRHALVMPTHKQHVLNIVWPFLPILHQDGHKGKLQPLVHQVIGNMRKNLQATSVPNLPIFKTHERRRWDDDQMQAEKKKKGDSHLFLKLMQQQQQQPPVPATCCYY
jgi:hypothetical protein